MASNEFEALPPARLRRAYGMAQKGSLPTWLGAVGSRYRAPYSAAALVFIVAAGFSVIANIKLVASVTDLAVYAVFIVVNLSLIALRFRQPNAVRRFEVPGRIGRVPILPVLGLASVVCFMAFLEAEVWLIGLALLGSGCLAWSFRPKRLPARVTPASAVPTG